MVSLKITFVVILSGGVLFRGDISYPQEIKKSHFQFNSTQINVDILEGKENLNAGITLKAVPRGMFLAGDDKDDFMLEWQPNIPCTFRYSTVPGSRILSNYPNTLNARGAGKLFLNPALEGMGTGVYYCILVSDEDSSVTSVEFKIIVQANAVPIPITPIGTITLQQDSPLFRWDPVEGVPYYFLFLSEGPLSIERNDEGEVVGLTGLNLTWQVITPSTSIKYGDPDPTGNFISSHVPPLLPDIEYNWIVLNSYGPSPDLISGEVAPVAPAFFNVQRPLLPQTPDLIQPSTNEIITSEDIVFQWTPVSGVSRYRFYLYEGREFANSEIDYTMWSQVTSETQIQLEAKNFLVRTGYHWRVVAETQEGIATSEWRAFYYNASSGWVKFTVNSQEGLLSRVEIDVRDETNGKLLLPFLTDTLGISKQALPTGNYSFTASRPGFLTSPRDFFAIPDNDTVFINVQLERSPSSISGQIVDESGLGIFNVTLELKSGNLIETQRTDEAGYFSFYVPQGNWSLRALKLGFEISNFQNISLQEGEALDLGQLVLKTATNIVNGEVIFAEDSQPFPGVLTRAETEDILFETVTNNTGKFRFTLGLGTWKITLDSQGFFSSPSEYTFALNQNQQVSATFQLFSGGLIYGKISFLDRGLSGALIQAFRIDTGELVQETITNIQGTYSLGLPEGEFELVVSKENFLKSRRTITINLGETLVENFTLTEAGFVKGTVINLETFEPVKGAEIFALEDSSRRTISNARGRYVLSLPPGIPFQIDASLPGFVSTGPYSVTTSPGDTITQDIFLNPLSGIIRGQVTDGLTPIKDALVEIIEEELQVFTDAEGRFEFEISPGDYNIFVSKECHFSKTVSVNLVAGEIKNIDIILEALKSVITGKVTDTLGDAIEGAEITASSDTIFTTVTNVNGHYELCLNSGIFRIVASHLGYFPSDTTLVIGDGDSLGDINFQLQDNFSKVTGTILDTLGNAISEALVTLTNADQTLIDTTDSNGSYFIDKIYPGLSKIQAAKEGFYGKPVFLNLLGQEQITLNLTLFPADGFISGTVRDSQDSTEIPDVIVSAEFSENPGKFFTTTTDPSGNYTLLNLPVVPNTNYNVFAFKDGFLSPTPKTNVLPKTSGVDFYLINKNGTIAGIVQDRDTAEPIYNAKVEASNPRGDRSIAFTNSLGKFLLEELVPTELYNITVTKNGFFAEVVQNVAAGDSGIVITLLRKYAFVMGRVLDYSTGEALENITIKASPNGLEGRRSSTVTNKAGEYFLRLVADNYTIQPVKLLHRSDPGFVQLKLSQGDTVSGLNFTLEPQMVKSIAIQRADQTEKPTISNLEIHCYEATARDDKNRLVNIGIPNWKVDVSSKAAVIDSMGCLTLSSDFVGDLTIIATDSISGVQGELLVQVFAPIDSTTDTVLFDDRGLQIEITKNAVLSRKEMLVSRQILAPAKKARAEFITSDFSYILKPVGLVFNKPVKLALTPPLNTQGQETFIAKWNSGKSEWDLLSTDRNEENLLKANILETGEYITLAISKSLTIENISLLPNPFSPFQDIEGRPGLKIEFNLSSNAAPNPLFTIKIYNLEGNLVRVLHDQTPFPRGHSTIYWDGRTDSGALARNGRYLVRFIVEDPAERKEEIKTVVLIK